MRGLMSRSANELPAVHSLMSSSSERSANTIGDTFSIITYPDESQGGSAKAPLFEGWEEELWEMSNEQVSCIT